MVLSLGLGSGCVLRRPQDVENGLLVVAALLEIHPKDLPMLLALNVASSYSQRTMTLDALRSPNPLPELHPQVAMKDCHNVPISLLLAKCLGFYMSMNFSRCDKGVLSSMIHS